MGKELTNPLGDFAKCRGEGMTSSLANFAKGVGERTTSFLGYYSNCEGEETSGSFGGCGKADVEGTARIVAFGEAIDLIHHHFKHLVKAATYGGLNVAHQDGEYKATVILDD